MKTYKDLHEFCWFNCFQQETYAYEDGYFELETGGLISYSLIFYHNDAQKYSSSGRILERHVNPELINTNVMIGNLEYTVSVLQGWLVLELI